MQDRDCNIHKQKNTKKLLIIGLDGIPIELLRTFADNGVMPCMKDILARGTLTPMAVTVPEISSVSWAGFMTGANSGAHGIFGFVDLAADSYQYRFPDFRDLRLPTFFDYLGHRDLRSVIINLPGTYPAREIPGVLVSGFVAPDLTRSVWPDKYLPILQEMGYLVDIDAEKGREQKLAFFSELFYSLQVRREAARYFWIKEDWQLFMLTITGTDRLLHFMFDAFLDDKHPLREEFIKYFHEVDRVIGEFYERTVNRDGFECLMLSDHGFVRLDREIYLNPILRSNGFQVAETRTLDTLADIGDDSKAFALDPSRIYIHQKGRHPRGNVTAGDYQKVRRDIQRLFETYQIGGERVIRRAYFKEEIYDGACLSRAPDLVLLSEPGFNLKAGFGKTDEHGTTYFTGMHHRDNAFFYSTSPEALPKKMSIFDVFPLIFNILGLSLPR